MPPSFICNEIIGHKPPFSQGKKRKKEGGHSPIKACNKPPSSAKNEVPAHTPLLFPL